DGMDAYRAMILKAYHSQLGYSRKSGENIVSIKVHETSAREVWLILAAIVAGISCGLLMKVSLNEAAVHFIDHVICDSVEIMFMNALSMMVTPLIFFAVLSGITSMTDTAIVGRLGGQLVGFSVAKLLATTVAAIAAGSVLFSDGMPELLPMIPAESAAEKFSLQDMIVGVIPSSLVVPFLKGNVLQVLFLACFFGVMINRAGDRAAAAKEAIEFMNRLCMEVLEVIMRFSPFAVFASMARLILSAGLDVLFSLGMVVLGNAFGTVLVFLVCAVFVAAFGGVSPVAFLKKMVPFAPVSFAMHSSSVGLPQTISFCVEKFGVSKKLALFTLPVGLQLNMNHTGVFVTLVAVLMARTYGIALDMNTLLSLLLSSFIISFTLPAAPGAGLIGLSTVFSAIGVPGGAVLLFLCIDPIVSLIDTVGNVASNVASTLIVSAKDKAEG
ncbi:MAG: dicarboxylate/amino acid:cation symporter, partial [Schwartzia sp.]|nr:dicarboxylate/amino acid:cation symporter [Schwartzia sp. (in: firmicutes)]